MHFEVEAWRLLASAFVFVPVKERRQEAVIRRKVDILAMAMGRMMLHSLALLLLLVCIACTFLTNGPLVEGMTSTDTVVSSSSWSTLSLWLASSSLSRIIPGNSLQEGIDKYCETSLSSSQSWRNIASWLASLSSSSSMMPSNFLQAKDIDFDMPSSPPSSPSPPNMMPGNSVQEEKDKEFDISLPSSSPSWWWLSSSLASSSFSSSSSAASSSGTGTMHNESKETASISCPPSCFRPNPVCGVDGITYWCGSVDAECANVEVDYKGFCDFDSKGTGGKGILAIQSLLLVHMVWLMLAALLVFLGIL